MNTIEQVDNDIRIVTQATYDEQEQLITKLNAEHAAETVKLADAKKLGDLSENSEYDSALKALAILEEQIKLAEATLSKMKVGTASTSSSSDSVNPGCLLELQAASGSVMQVKLVYPEDVEIPSETNCGRASTDSKFGEAVINKHVGDEVVYIDNALREQRFRILSIRAS